MAHVTSLLCSGQYAACARSAQKFASIVDITNVAESNIRKLKSLEAAANEGEFYLKQTEYRTASMLRACTVRLDDVYVRHTAQKFVLHTEVEETLVPRRIQAQCTHVRSQLAQWHHSKLEHLNNSKL